MTAAWGLRLGVHIGRRSRGKGEDPRYEPLLAKAPGSRYERLRPAAAEGHVTSRQPRPAMDRTVSTVSASSAVLSSR